MNSLIACIAKQRPHARADTASWSDGVDTVLALVPHGTNFLAALLIVGGLLMVTPVSGATPGYDDLMQTALQYRNSGDFEAAEQTLKVARELARETNEVDSLLGLMLAFQGRTVEAMRLLNEAQSRYPEDQAIRLARARVLSYEEDFAGSLTLTRQILQSSPDHLEALTLAARVSFYKGDLTQSKAHYQHALSLAPTSQPLLLGLYDVELALGNSSAASTLLEQAASIDPDASELELRRQRSLSGLPLRHEISSGFMISNIDGASLSNWYDRSLEYRYRSPSGNQIFLRTEHLHRFQDHDTITELGTILNLGGGYPLEVAVAYGDDSDFSPRRRLRFANSLPLPVEHAVLGKPVIELGYSHARYETGNVSIARVGVTQYFSVFDGWFTAAALRVKDENSNVNSGWTSGMHWQATGRTRVGYNYTDAPETENNLTNATEAHHLYLSHQFTANLAVRLDGSRNRRENSYSRESLSLSLQVRF